MAISAAELLVRISGDVTDLQRKLKVAEDAVGKTARDIEQKAKGPTTAFGGLAGAVGTFGIALGAAEIARGSAELALLGANAERIGGAFNDLAAGAGLAGDELLAVLRSASGNQISDLNLQLSANRAMLLGVADSAEEFSLLMEIARDRATKMGLSTTDAFQRLTEGLGKAEPEILDELGLIVDANEANERYAESIGKTTAELTKFERGQALTNAVLEQGRATLGESAITAEDASGTYARLGAAWDNARAAAGSFVSDALLPLADATANLLGIFERSPEGVGNFVDGLFGLLGVNRQLTEAERDQLAGWAEYLGVIPQVAAADDDLAASRREVTAETEQATGATLALAKAEGLLKEAESRGGGLSAGRNVRDEQIATREAVEATTAAIAEAERGLIPWEEALRAAEQDLRAKEQALRAAEAALEPYRAAVDAANRAVANKRREIELATAALKPYVDAMDAASAAEREAARDLELRERGLRAYREEVERTGKDVEDYRKVIEETEKGEQAYTDAQERATRGLREAEAARDAAIVLLDAEQAALDRDTAAYEALGRQIDAAERALQPFADRIALIEKAIADKNREIELAQRALRPYEQAVSDAASALRDAEAAVEASERALSPYRDAVERATDNLEIHRDELGAAKDAYGELEDGIKAAQAALNDWTRAPLAGSQQYADQLQTIDDQINAIRLNIVNAKLAGGDEQELERLEAQLDRLRLQREQLELTTGADLERQRRQLEEFADIDEEFTFDQIREGIYAAMETIANLTTELGPAKVAWDEKAAAVAAAEAALQGYQAALAEQEALVEAQRAGLETYREAEAAARLELEARTAAIEPLRLEQERLNDTLLRAQEIYAAQDALIDPLRAKEQELNLTLAERKRLLDETTKNTLAPHNAAIATWQSRLDTLKVAQDRWREETLGPLNAILDEKNQRHEDAIANYEREDALLDPLRAKLELANDTVSDTRDAYERAYKEGVEPLNAELQTLQSRANDAQTALETAQRLGVQPFEDAVARARDAVTDVREGMENWRDMNIAPLYTQLDNLKTKQDDLAKSAYEWGRQVNDAFNAYRNQGTTTVPQGSTQPPSTNPRTYGNRYWDGTRWVYIGSYASGVENFQGGLAYVHRDELLVNMAPGTDVIPAREAGRLGGLTINGDIVINAQPGQDGYALYQEFAAALKDELQRDQRLAWMR